MTPVLVDSQGPKDPLSARPGFPSAYPTSFEAPSSVTLPRTLPDVHGEVVTPPGSYGDGAPLELKGFPSPNAPSLPTPIGGGGWSGGIPSAVSHTDLREPTTPSHAPPEVQRAHPSFQMCGSRAPPPPPAPALTSLPLPLVLQLLLLLLHAEGLLPRHGPDQSPGPPFAELPPPQLTPPGQPPPQGPRTLEEAGLADDVSGRARQTQRLPEWKADGGNGVTPL